MSSQDLAESNLNIFHFCFNKGHEELQIITIHALCDVILEHPSLLAPPPPTNDPDTTSASVEEATPNKWLKPITEDFLKAFESDQPTLSHIGCIAASKLLLHNILPPTSTAEILKAFVNAYFNPETASNTALQQTLSYCLPAFCHSSRKNALLLAENCIEVIHKLVIDRDALREEYDEDDIDWVSWTVVANHLAEWTDARRVPVRGSDTLGVDASGKVNVLPPSQDPHVSLAIAILERVLSRKCDADEKKPLLTLLSKLNLSPPPAASKDPVKVESRDQDEELLRTMHALAAEAVENKAGPDATTRNFLVKLESALVKRLGEVEQQQSTQVQNAEDGVEAEAEAEADDTTVLPAPTAIKHEEAQQDQEQEGEQEESEIDVEGEEEDTMLAGMQGEGTRMPLFAEEDEDEDEEMQDVDMDDAASDVTVGRTVPRDQRETSVAVSESDIIDSLLESEVGSPSPRHRRVSRRRV
jgi:condensin complex subunit 3